MASAADLLVKNFIWRIESQTPTDTTLSKRFREIDLLRIDPSQSSGLDRAVSVLWLGSDGEDDLDGVYVTAPNGRIAQHRVQVEIYYATQRKTSALQTTILQDRHDIIKLLRLTDSYRGYSDATSSTAIGLCRRYRESDEIDRGEDTHWTYRSTWVCTLQETE